MTTNDPHVVVLIEPNYPGETCDVPTQINEVVGPFETADGAQKWVDNFRNKLDEPERKHRQFLITPLFKPNHFPELN